MKAWTLALPLVGACEADFARVESDCRTEIAAIGPDTDARVAAALLGPGCAEALGASVALDWGSFGFARSTLSNSPAGTYFLLGLLSIADGPSSSLRVLEDDPDLPPVALDGIKDLSVAEGFQEDTTSNEAWYEGVRTAVTEVVYGADEGGVAARYNSRTGVLTVYDAFVGGDLEHAWPLPIAGSMLLHEATHRLSSHTECPDGSGSYCDETPDGAYGVQVWWLSRWESLGNIDRGGRTCHVVDDVKASLCETMIVDSTDWPPCESYCD